MLLSLAPQQNRKFVADCKTKTQQKERLQNSPSKGNYSSAYLASAVADTTVRFTDLRPMKGGSAEFGLYGSKRNGGESNRHRRGVILKSMFRQFSGVCE